MCARTSKTYKSGCNKTLYHLLCVSVHSLFYFILKVWSKDFAQVFLRDRMCKWICVNDVYTLNAWNNKAVLWSDNFNNYTIDWQEEEEEEKYKQSQWWLQTTHAIININMMMMSFCVLQILIIISVVSNLQHFDDNDCRESRQRLNCFCDSI